ncbi:DnaB-like helicase C-terminal domain-containing protein [Nonomuraea sp. NPDC059023]|uniref:DnaB-like helicase C-terminal domain-containing protein n=1 Tax=unclassified Nonomuraea TaxID=2593643 RepID=UPI0036CA52CA
MDIERSLISRVIELGDLGPLAHAGITRAWFRDPESAQVWDAITSHKQTYGTVPSLAAVKADHPTYKLIKADEDLPYLLDKMREHRHLVVLETGLTNAVLKHTRRDVTGATAAIATVLAQIMREGPTLHDVDLTTNGEQRIQRYRELAELDGRLRGIPSGFGAIDQALGGFEGGQLITFVGPPKAGKSTATLLMAKAANDAGYSPLFIGFEMSNLEQEQRLDAFRAGIPHSKLRNGTLSPAEWKKLERSVHSMESMPSFHLSADSQSVMTLTGLRAKIEKIRPHIVFVDGVYMMQDEQGEAAGSPQALTNITRGLKRMAQQLNLPIVIATQALESKMNGKKVTSYSIGYSSSFVQDSDAVLAVERTDEHNINVISIVLARTASPMRVHYAWDWERALFEEIDDPTGSGWDEGGYGVAA